MPDQRLGLIDYGQCRALQPAFQLNLAKLIVAVAEHADDTTLANAMRATGVTTVNDNEEFLAFFARILFGRFEARFMDHSIHRKLHKADRFKDWPTDLFLVVRTVTLLRGLSMCLQHVPCVADEWS